MATGDNAPAVNCPIHGTHGALAQGECWYCVQLGNVVPAPPEPPPTGA